MRLDFSIHRDSVHDSYLNEQDSLVYIKDGKIDSKLNNVEIVFNGVYSTLDPFNAKKVANDQSSSK